MWNNKIMDKMIDKAIKRGIIMGIPCQICGCMYGSRQLYLDHMKDAEHARIIKDYKTIKEYREAVKAGKEKNLNTEGVAVP